MVSHALWPPSVRRLAARTYSVVMEAGMQSTRNDGSALDADAFQRLYPAEFYKEFLSQGIRPDGRRFQEARETTVGMDVVSTADASALCRIGSSAAIAGVKLVVSTRPALTAAATAELPLTGSTTIARPKQRYICAAGNPTRREANRGASGDQRGGDSADLAPQQTG